MGKSDYARLYKFMSPEDQRTFDRWLKANCIIGLLFTILIIAMAAAGSNSTGLREAAGPDATQLLPIALSEPNTPQGRILPAKIRAQRSDSAPLRLVTP